MSLLHEFNKEKLVVKIYDSRSSMGKAAADEVAAVVNKKLEQKDEVRMIFAAAPSQSEFLASLIQKNIDWSRVVGFHMDEYVGLKAGAVELFGTYLRNHVFEQVEFKRVHYFNPIYSDLDEECRRYEKLLKEKEIDIVCMGIGENGHLAFNDPPVADFNDPKYVKVVELDEACRMQQVHDGCFPTFDEVPTHALTLTIPALLSATFKSVVVPGSSKAVAVKKTLNDEISTECPATILREQENTVLFFDIESAKLIE